MLQCQFDSQSKERHFAIIGLASFFARCRLDAQRRVRGDNAGLDLVAVLATRPPISSESHSDMFCELIFRQSRRMNGRRINGVWMNGVWHERPDRLRYAARRERAWMRSVHASITIGTLIVRIASLAALFRCRVDPA